MASSTFRPDATTSSWSSVCVSMRISPNGRCRGVGIPIGDGEGLCETASSWRLLTGRLAPRFRHRSYSTTSEEPPLQISTATGTSPGALRRSLQCFQKAVRFAEEDANLELTCQAQLNLLANLADVSPPGGSVAILAEVQRNVSRLGDPHLYVRLLLHLARVEAKRDYSITHKATLTPQGL